MKQIVIILALLFAAATADASPFHVSHIVHSKKFWIVVGVAGAVAAIAVVAHASSSHSGSVRVIPAPSVSH